MVDWPAGLPNVQLVGMTDQRGATRVRSSVDVGPAIVRRRYTSGVRDVNVPVTFTNTERVVFDAWYQDDLDEGSISFVWTDPVTGSNVTFRFREDSGPQFKAAVGADNDDEKRWDTVLALEIIP